MSNVKKTVFLILQDCEDARPIIDAVENDNPEANIIYQPGLVRIESDKSILVNRETVEENLGREWDMQELHVSLISLGGSVTEDEDQLQLSWG